MTGLNESTVRVHLFRAIRRLRGLLVKGAPEGRQPEAGGSVVRLIDIVFRQGHLSERALIEAIVARRSSRTISIGATSAPSAPCELARWMDDVQTDAAELADAVFTPERLAAQQEQILRRLEQLDHPARVIAFPAASRPEPHGAAAGASPCRGSASPPPPAWSSASSAGRSARA